MKDEVAAKRARHDLVAAGGVLPDPKRELLCPLSAEKAHIVVDDDTKVFMFFGASLLVERPGPRWVRALAWLDRKIARWTRKRQAQ